MAAKKASAKSKRNSLKSKPMKAAAPKKLSAVKDPLTKSGIIKAIMDATCLPRKDVTAVFENLGLLIDLHVRSRGPGKFVLPGLLKITSVKKPATPARKGRNPFTGEEIMFKAKPARRVVKVRALRKLKDMAMQ